MKSLTESKLGYFALVVSALIGLYQLINGVNEVFPVFIAMTITAILFILKGRGARVLDIIGWIFYLIWGIYSILFLAREFGLFNVIGYEFFLILYTSYAIQAVLIVSLLPYLAIRFLRRNQNQ